MEKLSGNDTDSNFFDFLMLDKCLWVLKLETCCGIYAGLIFVIHVFGFIFIFLLTLRWCRNLLRGQIASMQHDQRQQARASQQPPRGSAEGDQGAAVVNVQEHGNVDQGEQPNPDNQPRPTGHSTLDNVKLTNPNTMGMLTYDILMAVVGALTLLSIINDNEEIYKMCIAIISFGNVIFLAITFAGALDRCILGQPGRCIFNLIPFCIIFYATMLLWSYAKVMDGMKD